jgi:hypothetical protein
MLKGVAATLPARLFGWHSTMLVRGFTLQVVVNKIFTPPCYAGPFSLALQAAGQPNGAADGSMLVDPNEVLRPENNGLGNIVSLLQPLPAQFNVSAGDILHVRPRSTRHLLLCLYYVYRQLAGVLGVVRRGSISDILFV